MTRLYILPLMAAFLILQPNLAAAYVGPGLGAGVLAAVLGVFAAIAMAVVALVWYPVKKLLRKRSAPVARAEQGQ
ncbi:hypothetical protein GLS40_06940 [Pseudooceanicola sp. 216_PA32_1]|uniref:Uncharacterized protein n=1 Tax=Pseudooceanicola pacificus TaxID=2676438 RepID=A0A844W3W5_9RHOB|nr:hypothetical protein [Pseudooceanicola pacificus]MWB77755.1 hypothetical protein [Pseudooceanicola pacificus]